MRSAGSPCRGSRAASAATAGSIGKRAVPVLVSASSSHRCTGRSTSILPFSTSIAISQQVIAEIPSLSDLSIACAPASERCSGDATSQNRAWVSSTITASGSPHRMSTHPRFPRELRRRPGSAPIRRAVRTARDGAVALKLRTTPPRPLAGSRERRASPGDVERWGGAHERRPQRGPRSAGGGSVERSRGELTPGRARSPRRTAHEDLIARARLLLSKRTAGLPLTGR